MFSKNKYIIKSHVGKINFPTVVVHFNLENWRKFPIYINLFSIVSGKRQHAMITNYALCPIPLCKIYQTPLPVWLIALHCLAPSRCSGELHSSSWGTPSSNCLLGEVINSILHPDSCLYTTIKAPVCLGSYNHYYY